MTKFCLAITIKAHPQDVDAVNTYLESQNLGPNNIGASRRCVLACSDWMLPIIHHIADTWPKTDISVGHRKYSGPHAQMDAAARGRWDKPEYKSTAPDRVKAKVDFV